jgi:hypothetical protein
MDVEGVILGQDVARVIDGGYVSTEIESIAKEFPSPKSHLCKAEAIKQVFTLHMPERVVCPWKGIWNRENSQPFQWQPMNTLPPVDINRSSNVS